MVRKWSTVPISSSYITPTPVSAQARAATPPPAARAAAAAVSSPRLTTSTTTTSTTTTTTTTVVVPAPAAARDGEREPLFTEEQTSVRLQELRRRAKGLINEVRASRSNRESWKGFAGLEAQHAYILLRAVTSRRFGVPSRACRVE
jgi:hypothetical protein